MAAPIAKQVLEALLGGAMTEVADNTRRRRPLPDRRAASARAGWPTSTAPRTRTSGREVALKVLHRRFAQDQEFVERFRREASCRGRAPAPERGRRLRPRRARRHLLHRDGVPARAHAQGDRQRARRRSTQERAIDLGVQILRGRRLRAPARRDPPGLQAAQRDRRTTRAAPRSPTSASPAPGASEMTETGSIMGTAQYLSPEQAQGHAVTAASDLYSIGVMLYEMLTGRLPFEGESAVVDRAQAPVRAAAADLAAAARRAPGARGRGDGRARQGPGAALAERRGVRRGARAPRGPSIEAGGAAGRARTRAAFAAACSRRCAASGGAAAARRRVPRRGASASAAGRGSRIGLLVLALARAAGSSRSSGCWQPTRSRCRAWSASSWSRRASSSSAPASRWRRARAAAAPSRSGARPGPERRRGGRRGLDRHARGVGRAGQRRVPSVAGLPQDAGGQASSSRRGLKVTVDERPSDTVREGFAIRTVPAAGTVGRARARASRCSSAPGPSRSAVPDVVGPVARVGGGPACATRASSVGRCASRSSDKPEGEVIAQDPAAGTEVDKGARVTHHGLRGPDAGDVPDVVGPDRGDARGAARGRPGLPVQRERDRSTDPAAGRHGARPAPGRRRRGGRRAARS